jgi:gallidermin/nisin family lantibiotic
VIAVFEKNGFDLGDFDLDLQIISNSGAEEEDITSKSLCTPGCGKTGTGNSFCCG